MIDEKKKKTIIVSSIAVFVLVPITITVLNIISSIDRKYVKISNYSDYVKNIPNTEKSKLEENLNITVNLNIDKEKIPDGTNAVIRKNTYKQDLSEGVHTTSFIVDIENIKQSFKLTNRYSSDGLVSDYTHTVDCLDREYVIYTEFKCKDLNSEENNLPSSDPAIKLFPIENLDYSAYINGTFENKTSIEVKIFASESDFRIGINNKIDNTRSEIKNLLKNNNLNPENYSILISY